MVSECIFGNDFQPILLAVDSASATCIPGLKARQPRRRKQR